MPRSGEFELRKFVAPELILGVGARCLAGRYARNLHVHKAMVVTDPGVIAAGWTKDVINSLEAENIEYDIFSRVSPNPRADEVMLGAEECIRSGCDATIAVGGGSVIDCAKGIGIVQSNGKHILAFEGVDEVRVPGPPLICIATTNSGADLSQFTIITDTKRRLKTAIVSKSVVADVALVDPMTTTTMDAFLTACTALDALSQGMEAYVSNAHSPITDLHALEAVRLVAANLIRVMESLNDIEARAKMMLGGLHASLAFSNASLGLVHAMSHALGGVLDLHHGEAIGLLLTHVIDFNFDSTPGRFVRIAEAMGLHNPSKRDLVAEVARLVREIGLVSAIEDTRVQPAGIPELAAMAMRDVCIVTNPRIPTLQDIEEIYGRIMRSDE